LGQIADQHFFLFNICFCEWRGENQIAFGIAESGAAATSRGLRWLPPNAALPPSNAAGRIFFRGRVLGLIARLTIFVRLDAPVVST
jgi:hypothetical protein